MNMPRQSETSGARSDGRKLSPESTPYHCPSRDELDALRHDAECWRLLSRSPHIADLLVEWREWVRRAAFRQTSSAVSAAAAWGSIGPTYAELERRRAEYAERPRTSEEIKARAARMWEAIELQIARKEDERRSVA